jgi:MFS transporter, DHA1 family, tetracycline resistance protein
VLWLLTELVELTKLQLIYKGIYMASKRFSVLTLFAVVMVDALGWGIAFPVFVPILIKNTSHVLSQTTTLADRHFLYELALGIYCLFMFLMSPFLGCLSDKYGRKKILILSMLGNFLGFLIAGFAIFWQSYIGILIGRSISGMTAGSLPIAQAAIIDISDDSQQASRLGLTVFANIFGFAIGPIIGGFLMDKSLFGIYSSVQLPFFVSAAMGLIGATLLLCFFKETYVGNRKIKINLVSSFSPLLQIFTNRKISVYCLVLLLFLFGWSSFFSTIPVFLTKQLDWSASKIGYFISYIGLLFGISVLWMLPKLTKLFPLPSITLGALVAVLICDFIFPNVNSTTLPWLVMLLTVAAPQAYVTLVTMLSLQVNKEKQGEIMGLTGSIFAFAWGFGPIFSGILLKKALIMPYIMVGFCFITAIFILKKKIIGRSVKIGLTSPEV